MSLENEIKKLREAIEINTEALKGCYYIPEDEEVVEKVVENVEDAEGLHDEPIEKDKLLEEVTNLTNVLMEKGVEKKEIKSMITSLGSPKLSAMDEKQLQDLKDQLLSLKVE